MKALVVFYSRTGRTRIIAEAIARSLKADIEEVKEDEGRSGLLGFLRSGYEAVLGKLARIQPASKRPEEYDLVVVGSPVWVGRLSSPMRTYLTHHGGKIRKVAFFCTCIGGEGKIFREMEMLSGKPIAKLCVRDREIEAKEHIKKIQEFVKALQGELESVESARE